MVLQSKKPKTNGSGIYVNSCRLTIANCIVRDSDRDGIEAYCDGDDPTTNLSLINCIVEDNVSRGINCEKNENNPATCHLDIDRCTIRSNNSDNLYISDYTVDVTDSIFSGNSNYGIREWSSELTVERCDISDTNTGIFHGSGGANATIRRCTIQRNKRYGIDIGSNAEVILNVISDNNTGVNISGSNDRLISNLIYDNDGNGINGVYISGVAEIRNNTIVYNGGYGLSAYSYDFYYSDVNSNIIYGNTSGQLYGSFTRVNYNCIQNYTGGTNINTDPCFVNKDVNDYHLKMNSNCIDRGDPCFNDANLFDIDGEDRIMDGDNNGVFRVDIGADEFCPYDLSQDGFVNFLDFAVLGLSWQTSQGDADYNDRCDFYNDGKIDCKDLCIFCDYWLSPSDWADIGGQGAYFAQGGSGGEEMIMSEPESMPALSEAEGMMSMASEQLLLLAGESETASIYLLSDVNEPNSGDEVTVQVYSDVPLFAMGLGITVTGDANITDAMSTADCNEYGWDPSWPTDPLIDPTGWVYISGVQWESDANGVVGYIKFRYNSGQVSVSITEGDAYDADCESVLISGEALTFGADPNES